MDFKGAIINNLAIESFGLIKYNSCVGGVSMLRENLSVRIPCWLGEKLDLDSYLTAKSKSETVTEILERHYKQHEEEKNHDRIH